MKNSIERLPGFECGEDLVGYIEQHPDQLEALSAQQPFDGESSVVKVTGEPSREGDFVVRCGRKGCGMEQVLYLSPLNPKVVLTDLCEPETQLDCARDYAPVS